MGKSGRPRQNEGPHSMVWGGGGAQVANKAEGVGRQVGARPCSMGQQVIRQGS